MTETYEDSVTTTAAATDRLLATLDGLTDDDLRGPSLLPDWTRGHVLAHVARNADGMRNLVTWARTGVETPQYSNRERRGADIERDAPRSLAEHRRDVEESARALDEDLRALSQDPEALGRIVGTQPGREFPGSQLAARRMREVEIHHVDLDAGYTTTRWPGAFVARTLSEIAEMFAARSDVPSMTLRTAESNRTWELGDNPGALLVSGPERGLLAWLIGRADGWELSVKPEGPLPQPPAWT